MGEVTKYTTREEPYNESCFQDFKSVNRYHGGKMGKRLGFETALVDVAPALVSGVPNSAGLERCFSTTGRTYGKLRNQMEAEKCGNLHFSTTN